MSIIDNPLVLAVLVIVLTWLIRKLKWESEGIKALWLTMGISLVIASVDTVFGGGAVLIPAWPGWVSPGAVLVYIGGVLGSITANSGVIFASAQAIYQLLRREIVNRSPLITRL